ncbi:MAG: S8 family serine peptidase, partial [Sedimentisphaerales bacterium]|nr:S8 family serine peptidase [Sedimentisphaerales bacterium]
AREYDPKLIFRWLYVSRKNAAAQLHIDEPIEDGNSLYVTATHSVDKTRLELVIDPKTKLVKELSKYRMGEKEDKLDTQIKVMAYNQPIDPSMFKLSGIPEDALVIDQIDQLVGLEQGHLANNEIVVKVVRETLEAAIAKDYEKVSRLMEGVPGDTVEKFIEEEFDAKLIRVASVGQPIPHEKSGYHIYVPCEIEVENAEKGKWTVNIITMTEFICYQAGRRWVMHRPEKDDGSRISTNRIVEARESVGEKLIVPGERVGDFKLGTRKDEVLKKWGKPETIFLGSEKYTLNNLPRMFFMVYNDLSFSIEDDIVTGITAHSPFYAFANGLKVGDSEQKVKQTFGNDVQVEEGTGKDYFTYEDKGLMFEIHKEDRTVIEINVEQTSSRGRESSFIQSVPSIKPFDDVRAKDISQYDLSAQEELIAKLQFNRETVWPERAKMPPGSDPEKILTDAMNPGLGVRELHRQGITGKGVNVAMIDQPLFKDHLEYDGKIAAYYDTGCDTDDSSMHGPAVASLLVGTNCGTAPGARVYYVATPSWKTDAAFDAKGLEWIIEQNRKLPEADKIRVVSVSAAPNQSSWANRQMWDKACARAEGDGIMVLDCTDSRRGFIRRGWYDLGDPENVSKFNLGSPPKREFKVDPAETSLYVPSSCRTTAQHYDYHDRISYIYWGRGGLSWAIPYCAGVLAMGWQVRPDLTPAQMKELLFASAYVHESGAKIIHPKAFIDVVRKHPGDQQQTQTQKISAIKLSKQPPGPIPFPKIDRHPIGGDFGRGALESLPHHDPKSTKNWQVDLRGRDVSRLDLRKSLDDLLYADFDSRTAWPTPNRMPEGFDRERIIKLGKNPGLGVRKVHERGITGRGIGIAIVDQPLLTKHQEYADRLRLYEEINVKPGSDAAMHGAAVASIALGKTVGVAPEADLYYIGSWTGDWGKGEDGFEWNFAYYAQAVRRILEINEQLPDDRKIRVISMSVGWSSKRKGYDEMTDAVEQAKKAGMLVVCSCIDDVHGFVFDGLGRAPLDDPDDFLSYEPGGWLAEGFYRGQRKWNQLWVPMDSRTTAAPNGIDEYVFYRQGGWSWAIPYIAGVYALAAQVDPEITPERFWKLAMKSGRTVEVEHEGRTYELGPIVDPVELISTLQKN